MDSALAGSDEEEEAEAVLGMHQVVSRSFQSRALEILPLWPQGPKIHVPSALQPDRATCSSRLEIKLMNYVDLDMDLDLHIIN